MPQPKRDTDNESKSFITEVLRDRIREAKRLGFEVRLEPLDGETADWCVIGGRRVLVLDLAASADEQLCRLEEILSDFSRHAA